MPEEQAPEKEREIVQTQEIPQTNYTYVKTPDFRSIYSNNVVFTAALFDFSMIFGEVIEKEQISQTTGNVTVEQKVKIIMSPLHAKLFLQVAARQLRAYEQRFGEIKSPAGMFATENTSPPKTGGE